MMEATAKPTRLALFLLLILLLIPSRCPAGTRALSRSIVKIYVTVQRDSYDIPWRSSRPGRGNGSGFIINGKWILTNAHVISNARFIELKKSGDPKRYRAKVIFRGLDCDLAIVEAEDPAFYDGTKSVRLASHLPELSDTVTVLGYPMGGERVSLTEGVVSRIDYSGYSHSGVDQHLVLQVDAAINPGNSGGPVFFKGKVVGLAFQGLRQGDNIGYAIPVPVIRRFLKDIADGSYDGYAELGAAVMDTRNPALRDDLGLPEDESGAAVYYVDPFGAANGHLYPRDVLLTIDDYDIAEDGTVELNGNTVEYAELLERKQWGDTASFRVWRSNRVETVSLPLANPPDPYVFRNIYDRKPEYFVTAGLVMVPLTREYLRTVGRNLAGPAQSLTYAMQYAKIDRLHTNRNEFVVFSARLPHPVNTYTDRFLYGIVAEVNGVAIRRIEDVEAAVQHPVDGFHTFRFEGRDEFLVIDADAAALADPQILSMYGVPSSHHFGGTE